MKQQLLAVCVAASSLLATGNASAQVQGDTIKVPSADSLPNKKEEKNRNVMLNAENNSGPRSVNFGLPFGGDIVILENDVNVPAGTKRIYFQVTVLGAMGHVDVDGVELSPKPAAATTQPASDGKRQATSAHRVAAGSTDIFVPHHRAIPVFLFNRVIP